MGKFVTYTYMTFVKYLIKKKRAQISMDQTLPLHHIFNLPTVLNSTVPTT